MFIPGGGGLKHKGEPNQTGRVQAHSKSKCSIDSTEILQIGHVGEGEQCRLNKFSFVTTEFEMAFHKNNLIFGCTGICQITFQNFEDIFELDSPVATR